jgi:hypothetical protein
MKSTLKPYHNKLKALFAQHVEGRPPEPPQDKPLTETVEPIAVGPEPTDPPPYDEKALTEEVAKQLGWQVGDEAPGRVTNRKIVNKNYVWATVQSWSDDVLVSVHDRSEWPAGSPIKCYYKGTDSDGHLVFNSKEHGPKWKRRGAR